MRLWSAISFAFWLRLYACVLNLLLAPPLLAAPTSGKDNESPNKKEVKPQPRYGIYGSINFPHPLDLGIGLLQPKGSSYIVSAGFIEKDLRPGNKLKDLVLSMKHLELKYRSEPYTRHPLFLEIALGYQEIFVKGTRATNFGKDEVSVTADVKARMTVRSVYYTPKVGITKHFKNDLSLSWGFGFMIPAFVDSDFSATITGDPLLDGLIYELEAYKKNKRDIERIGKRVGQLGLPLIDIIEAAYRF